MPRDPVQELLVALAGPAVNVLIVLALLPLILVNLAAMADPVRVIMEGGILLQLATVNVMLLLFNLLPAFPMDGGRVVRALLATMTSYLRATQIAATLGTVMAAGFAVVGLFVTSNPLLALIGVMVYFGARQEVQAARVRARLEGVPVRSAMMTRFYTLAPDELLHPVLQALMLTPQSVFPVTASDRVVGVLTQEDLREAYACGFIGRVSERMAASVPPVDENASLDSVVDRLQSEHAAMVPVERDGKLVGMVTPETVRQWMAFESAARDPRRDRTIHDAVFVPMPPQKIDTRG